MKIPYIKEKKINDKKFKFYYGNNEAVQWYDPIKSIIQFELEWIEKNIDFRNKKILDIGAHHGYYGVSMSAFADFNNSVDFVDPIKENCFFIKKNISLNNINGNIYNYAVSNKNIKLKPALVGSTNFEPSNNGKVFPVKRLDSFLGYNIIKVDIEGEEFSCLPKALESMLNVETWIIDIHPWSGDSSKIFNLFKNYKISLVDRHKRVVREVQEYNDKNQFCIICRK